MDEFSTELLQGLQAQMEKVTQAFQVLAENMVAAWNVVARPISEILHQCGMYSEVELEEAYRAYARWYNWRHPGRRVSWRRLNRVQRAEAMLGFQAQMDSKRSMGKVRGILGNQRMKARMRGE